MKSASVKTMSVKRVLTPATANTTSSLPLPVMTITVVPGYTRPPVADNQGRASSFQRKVTFGAVPVRKASSSASPFIISSRIGSSSSLPRRGSDSAVPLYERKAVCHSGNSGRNLSPGLTRSLSALSDQAGFSYTARNSSSRRHSPRTSSSGRLLMRSASSVGPSRPQSKMLTQHVSRTPAATPRVAIQSPAADLTNTPTISFHRLHPRSSLHHPPPTHVSSATSPVGSGRMFKRHHQKHRPMTTTSARLLGAELYPALRWNDLDREKALFRSGVRQIGKLFSEMSRSQSARWITTASKDEGNSGGEADKFCRASLAEAQKNNADVARVYHVVPQRVVSARSSGRHGVNVNLQQLNQSLCNRHQAFGRGVLLSRNHHSHDLNTNTNTNTARNSGFMATPNSPEPEVLKITEEKTASDSSSLDKNSDKNYDTCSVTNLEDGHGSNTAVEIGDNSLPNDEKNIPSYTKENKDVTELENNEDRSCSSPKGINDTELAQVGDMDSNIAKSDSFSDVAKSGMDSSGSSDKNISGLGRAYAALQQTVRGVDSNEHSLEWMEETKMKHDDSVAILSEQLHTMFPEQPDDLLVLSTPQGIPVDEVQNNLHNSSAVSLSRHLSEDGGETGSHEREEEFGHSSERVKCMKTMQCEVLGPYSCADCTKIRHHERLQREQMSLYPDLVVDPRILVAPDKLRRLTASLPSQLTSQRNSLDCGCVVNMHPDFLFPMIVTDHDIQTRLKTLRKKPDQRLRSSTTDCKELVLSNPLKALPPSRGKGEDGEGNAPGGGQHCGVEEGEVEEEEEEEVSMSPTDMRVTVRYTTPSPEQKGIFLTN